MDDQPFNIKAKREQFMIEIRKKKNRELFRQNRKVFKAKMKQESKIQAENKINQKSSGYVGIILYLFYYISKSSLFYFNFKMSISLKIICYNK